MWIDELPETHGAIQSSHVINAKILLGQAMRQCHAERLQARKHTSTAWIRGSELSADLRSAGASLRDGIKHKRHNMAWQSLSSADALQSMELANR